MNAISELARPPRPRPSPRPLPGSPPRPGALARVGALGAFLILVFAGRTMGQGQCNPSCWGMRAQPRIDLQLRAGPFGGGQENALRDYYLRQLVLGQQQQLGQLGLISQQIGQLGGGGYSLPRPSPLPSPFGGFGGNQGGFEIDFRLREGGAGTSPFPFGGSAGSGAFPVPAPVLSGPQIYPPPGCPTCPQPAPLALPAGPGPLPQGFGPPACPTCPQAAPLGAPPGFQTYPGIPQVSGSAPPAPVPQRYANVPIRH